jgi:Flp pilus assembly protein TadG
MTGRRPRRRHADSGNAALELVILAPVLLFLLGLVIAAGRVSTAQGAVDAAARDAARQASIARDYASAEAAAVASAGAVIRGENLGCTPAVRPDLQGFSTPPGQPASVTVTVSCAVPLSGLLVPGLPGSKTLTATFSSPIDPYRGR